MKNFPLWRVSLSSCNKQTTRKCKLRRAHWNSCCFVVVRGHGPVCVIWSGPLFMPLFYTVFNVSLSSQFIKHVCMHYEVVCIGLCGGFMWRTWSDSTFDDRAHLWSVHLQLVPGLMYVPTGAGATEPTIVCPASPPPHEKNLRNKHKF